jgi:glycosyltransferase involved in cell wall biosynthesis
MYPSEDDKVYGIFVKNFEKNMEKYFTINKIVISGRGKNKLEKIKKYFTYLKEVSKEIKKNNYNFIYIHNIGHSLLPLLFLSNYLKKPLILNAHGSDVLSKNKTNRLIQKIVKKIVKNANLIVVPSHYFKDIICDRFDINQSNVFISPSGGIDTNLFKPIKPSIKHFTFTIGYVSRIDEGKGWDTLLKAIKLLIDNNINNFKVMIIGGGSQEREFQAMIQKLQLGDIINYIGKVPHSELVIYYNKMDVFTFTTRLAESLGLVGLEAMACGVPVIGSSIGGLKEYIKPNYNGDLFETNNQNELFKKLKYFINMDKETINSYSKNSIQTANLYGSDLVTKNLKQKLDDIIYEKI